MAANKCKIEDYFPYDWIDNLQKLSETKLPPHEAFYNQLKAENISKEYQYCVNVWNVNRMETFSDFLIWYNNKDVPFLEAIDKMFAFYKYKQTDMFKQAISVPGLTLRHLF